MYAENYHLVLLILNCCKILLQPFHLMIKKTLSIVMTFCSIWLFTLIYHILHEYEVNLSDIERIVYRTKMLLILADQVQFSCAH